MAATATRPRDPKMTPMAMAPPVGRPDGGTNGGAEVVTATGQVVKFSWGGGRSMQEQVKIMMHFKRNEV